MERSAKLSFGRIFSGIFLIAIGIFLLIGQLTEMTWGKHFWPIFLLLGGLLFYGGYFSSKKLQIGNEGLLFPGTYLIILGVLFLLLNFIGWAYMKYLWPTFILGVAAGLGVMYQFTAAENVARKKALRSSIITLTVVSAALYLLAIKAAYIWPLALILIGLLIIFRGFKKI